MDMSTTISMIMSSTASGAASPTTTSTMNMADDGMGMGGPNACKISMTWNWYTVGACFISKTWRITSSGMFAGSCIGVIFLVISLEFLRRVSRECDSYVARKTAQKSGLAARPSSTQLLDDVEGSSDSTSHMVKSLDNKIAVSTNVTNAEAAGRAGSRGFTNFTRSELITIQFFRALIHMLQFGVAYFVMLLAMYYNGYFIICILIGAFLGAFIFSWDQTLNTVRQQPAEITGCCG